MTDAELQQRLMEVSSRLRELAHKITEFEAEASLISQEMERRQRTRGVGVVDPDGDRPEGYPKDQRTDPKSDQG